jgi:hypothetical protein
VSKQQLSLLIDTSTPKKVLKEVKRLFLFHYPAKSFRSVRQHFELVDSLFRGAYAGYLHCNTEYHDFAHTVDTFLATMRLIDGFNVSEAPLAVSSASALLSAALFHDTGYIQKDWDTLGTGAKYTREHVTRSKEFVVENSHTLLISPETVAEINEYIDSTGLTPAFKKEADASLQETTASVILGAADLIAQMADRVYLEKLLFLYYEFREAGIDGYATEFDIIRKTVGFYEITQKRLEGDYAGVHHWAERHFQERFGIGKNLYIDAIERNISYIRKILEDPSTNFRAKLHRISV